MEHVGEALNLTRITRAEMGVYLCIASNGVPPTVSKRITVDVECELNGNTPRAGGLSVPKAEEYKQSTKQFTKESSLVSLKLNLIWRLTRVPCFCGH